MIGTQAAAPKRVWILGAGFSRSLGGPLMGDLLSLSARHLLLTLYRQQISEPDAQLIFWLYHCGAGFPEGFPVADLEMRSDRRWHDAEDFLAVLDAGDSDPAKEALISDVYAQLINSRHAALLRERYPSVFAGHRLRQPHELLSLAKRVIAASCSGFLHRVTLESARAKERWLSYQQWLGLLGATDTIITFNYDRVIELLQPTLNGVTRSAFVAGVNENTEDETRAAIAGRPSLLKLHGSVNWSLQGGRIHSHEWDPALLNGSFELALATPGDGKMKMAGGTLQRLWNRAESALRDADVATLLGFRFPQADAFPRDRLLGALRENEKEHLQVHVVLGPEQNADVRRVLALLRWPVRASQATFDQVADYSREVIAHSMWAEDFLSVWAGRAAMERGMSFPTAGPR